MSGATSCAGNSSSAFASGPEHGVSWSTTSVAPALVDQYFFAWDLPPRLCFSRRFNLTVVRVLFTLLPRLIDHFRPSVHLQVLQPWDGGSRGAHPSEVGPRLSQLVFLDVRRVSSHGRKTDPGVLLLFWGDFGGRAPTAVGDQSYLGPVYGEYLGYPSDPYRPHTLEQSPPSDFGPVYVFLVPFASPEDDFSGDVDNFRRVVPRVVSLIQIYGGSLPRCDWYFRGAVAKF